MRNLGENMSIPLTRDTQAAFVRRLHGNKDGQSIE
jgi:hypothetical protein